MGVAHWGISEPEEHEKGKKGTQKRVNWPGMSEPKESQAGVHME